MSAAICAIILSSCTTKDTADSAELQFPVTKVIEMDTMSYTDYVAEIHALQNVEIRARVSGYLEKFHIDEGQHVKENQLLFTINNREYAEEFAKAKAAYKSAVVELNVAELELKNSLQLAEKKIISSTEIELAKNKLEAQKANLEEAAAHQAHAQLKLANTEIRAPFTGIVNRIPYKVGSLIAEGSLLTSISENDEVYAYFDVSEKEYLSYARNIKKDTAISKLVTLLLADGTAHKYQGRIETIEGEIDAGTGNIAFRARFKNPEKLIKHGASGKVRLKRPYENVLIIPQKSTFEIQDKLYVYVVDATNNVHIRNIETAYRLPHLFIVSKGLQKGDLILYEGIQNAKDGMKIKPQLVNMQSIIKLLASN